MLLLFPRGLKPLPARKSQEVLGGPAHEQNVPRPYVAITVRRGDLPVAPLDVQHRDPIAFAPPELGQGAAVRGGVLRDVQLRDEAADVVLGGQVRRPEAPRQQHPAGGEQVQQAHGETDEPQRGDREHPKAVEPSPHRLAVHDEVGGGPHQGDGAAENRDEGERHEIPRSRLLGLLGERDEDGQEDQHDGGRHEKGREERADEAEREHARVLAAQGRGLRPGPDGGDETGLAEPQAEHEHRADRHGGAAGQTRHGLGRRQDAGEEKDDRDRDGDLVHPNSVEGEQDERRQGQAQHERDLEGHPASSPSGRPGRRPTRTAAGPSCHATSARKPAEAMASSSRSTGK